MIVLLLESESLDEGSEEKCVAAPTVYRKDSFCGSYTFEAVSLSWTAETNTPAKCQAVVEKECKYKRYLARIRFCLSLC